MTIQRILEKDGGVFARWKAHDKFTEGNPKGAFVYDGLIQTPDRDEEVVDQQWKQSNIRIAFIVKDNNQRKAGSPENYWDSYVYKWCIEQPDNTLPLNQPFFRNIANILYGITHIHKEDVSYQNIVDKLDDVKLCFASTAFAIIESKKQPGIQSIKDKDLSKNLDVFGHFLYEELDILQPNILVCMGGPIYKHLIKRYSADDLVACGGDNNVNIYYVRSKNIVFMYSGHPSRRWNKSPDVYNGVIHWFRKFANTEYYNRILKNTFSSTD